MNHNICVLSLTIFSLYAVIKYVQKYRQYHEQRPIRTSQCFRKTKIQSSGASFVSFWQSKQKWKHFRTWWKMKYKWLKFYSHIKGTASRLSACSLIKLLFSNLLLILSVNNPTHMYLRVLRVYFPVEVYFRVTWSKMEEY